MEQQTTPPLDLKTPLEEIAVQTLSPEEIVVAEKDIQTSKSISPELETFSKKPDLNTCENQTTPKIIAPK